MSESDKREGLQEGEGRENGVYIDPYTSESSQDIYTAPEVVEPSVVAEETETAAVVADTHGLFSGSQAEGQPSYGNQNSGYGVQPP